MTAGTSGGCGDIIYSIPVMKKLGVTRIYVKENWYRPPYHSLYSVMRDLLKMHCFEVLPTPGGYDPMNYEPGLNLDFDMDRFRLQPKRGKNHIMVSMLTYFGLSNNGWQKPWLTITGESGKDLNSYNLINLTPRWRDNSRVNWRRIFENIKGPAYFIGFPEEHDAFCRLYGQIEHLPTDNILHMAQLIRDCQALYCNQSVALTIAQGLGKCYFLEVKPGKTNTLMYTHNENILR